MTKLVSARSPIEHAYSANMTSPGPWEETRVLFPHQSCFMTSMRPSRTIPRQSTGSPLRRTNSPLGYLSLRAFRHLHIAVISSSDVPRKIPVFLRMEIGLLMMML